MWILFCWPTDAESANRGTISYIKDEVVVNSNGNCDGKNKERSGRPPRFSVGKVIVEAAVEQKSRCSKAEVADKEVEGEMTHNSSKE